MKKLILLLGLLLLTGCSDTTELGDRAIIQLAAVDFEDGEFTLNALLFSAGGSGGEVDVTKTNVIKVSGSGKTLGEAVKQLSLIDGKEIYMSESKLLVLGAGFEEADIISLLTMLYRDMRCSLNMPVCCAEKAEMLTDMQFVEGITAAEKPYSMIMNAYLTGTSPKTTLLDILSDNEGGRTTLVPSFEKTENGSGMTSGSDGKTAVLNGSRLIKDGHLTLFADEEETAGYMLLSEGADGIPLNYMLDEGELTCEAYNIEVEFEENGEPVINASFRTRTGQKLSEKQEQQARQELDNMARAGMRLWLAAE
ncbi:MAG: hypothetical protein IJO91_04280 [Oscillospiraceae bacterium]|nr:hypothetical protein [Oscillospiraceae bacterium]